MDVQEAMPWNLQQGRRKDLAVRDHDSNFRFEPADLAEELLGADLGRLQKR